MNARQRTQKTAKAARLIREARTLLGEVAADYSAESFALSGDEQAEWRVVVDMVAPLDRLAENGLLDG